jgi:hypothetical protein
MVDRAWISAILVVMMAAGAIALPPARAQPRGSLINTDSEPNDDFANATLVVPGAGNTIRIAGTADANDSVDFYKIRLNFTAPTTAEKLNVSAHVDTNQAAVRVFIYDTNAMNMVLDADANPSQDHTAETVASHTGDYYVWYECQVFQGAVGYNITFTKTTVTYNFDIDGTTGSATNISGGQASFSGALSDPSDQADFYTFSLASDAAAADVVTFYAIPSAGLSLFVEAYLPNLTYLATEFHYTPVQNDQPPAGSVQTGSFGAMVPGDYYIRLVAAYGSGTYNLTFLKTTVDLDGWNSADTAKGLPDFSSGHWLDFQDTLGKDVDKEDYFSFPASLGQVVNATLRSLDYNATLGRPQITMELKDSTNTTYGSSSGIAKNVCHADGISPETTLSSLIHVSLLNYQGGAGSYSVNLTIDNPPSIYPTKWETPFTVNESSYAVLDLRTIFFDSDSDQLTYSAVNNDAGKTKVDFQLDSANFSTLQPAWTGTENFTVTATDPFGYSADANILVTVVAVNHRPYIIDGEIRDISCHPGDKLSSGINLPVNLSNNFYDDDILNPAMDDYLTYHNGSADPLNIVFQVIHGTLKQSGGLTIDVPEMPDLTSALTVVVSFWATDTFNLSTGVLTCNITVYPPVNHLPRWTANFTDISMNESQPGKPSAVSFDLGKYCTDPDAWDSGNISYAAKNYNVSAFTVTITNALCRITPRVGFYTLATPETITFNATDTKGAGADWTVNLIVTHVYTPPMLANFSPQYLITTIDEGAVLNFSVVVNIDSQIANLTPQPVKYRWYLNGTIQTATTGNYVFRTDFTSTARSPYNITFVFNDSVSETTKYWRVVVNNVNQPPIDVKIISPAFPRLNFTSGDKVRFQAAIATDPDDPNATLLYEWKDAGVVIHTGPSFDRTTLSVGTHTIVLSVTDADGGVTEDTITIRIKPTPTNGFIPGMEGLVALAALGAAAAVAAAVRRRK